MQRNEYFTFQTIIDIHVAGARCTNSFVLCMGLPVIILFTKEVNKQNNLEFSTRVGTIAHR